MVASEQDGHGREGREIKEENRELQVDLEVENKRGLDWKFNLLNGPT